jgi:hypothetical protein
MGLSGDGDIVASCSFGDTWGICCFLFFLEALGRFCCCIESHMQVYGIGCDQNRTLIDAIAIARFNTACNQNRTLSDAIPTSIELPPPGSFGSTFWEKIFLVEGYLLFAFLSFGSFG